MWSTIEAMEMEPRLATEAARDDLDRALGTMRADYEDFQTQEAEATAEARSSDGGAQAADCDSSYPDICVPPVWAVGDLDCDDVGESGFTVFAPDPHGFDADFDGIGCEW